MNDFNLIPVKNIKAWNEALTRCGQFDTYHLPEYHLIAEEMGEGEGYLFFYHQGNRCAALPFLLRPLAEVNGLEDNRYADASSVYGYPGPVISIMEDAPETNAFRKSFQSALMQVFNRLSVVTFFSRTNPLLSTSWIFKDMAEILPLGSTIAVDLSKPDAEQIKHMTKGHRYDIRKARKEGVVVEEDQSFAHIDKFITIYNATMDRVGASDYYYFPKTYYQSLKNHLGDLVKLYFARVGENIVGASIFLMTGEIIQYHLSGMPIEFSRYNGAKVILDSVRSWGSQNGFSWLHLGGGAGSSEDSLFRFKTGFSKSRHAFKVLRMVINPKVYSEACEARKQWLKNNDFSLLGADYFPIYRHPYK